MFHDPVEIAAARALFRLGHRDGHRIKDAYQLRHMLYYLGVVLDDLSPVSDA